jgi:hypothetical protein
MPTKEDIQSNTIDVEHRASAVVEPDVRTAAAVEQTDSQNVFTAFFDCYVAVLDRQTHDPVAIQARTSYSLDFVTTAIEAIVHSPGWTEPGGYLDFVRELHDLPADYPINLPEVPPTTKSPREFWHDLQEAWNRSVNKPPIAHN